MRTGTAEPLGRRLSGKPKAPNRPGEREMVDTMLRNIEMQLEERHMTWADLSKNSGVARSTLSTMFNERHLPNVYTLHMVARALGTTCSELIGETGTR